MNIEDNPAIEIMESINKKKILKPFIREHYHILSNIYNNIFKDYHDILDFDTFVLFALDKSTQNVRLYKN